MKKYTPTPWKTTKAGDNTYIYIPLESKHFPVHQVIANMDEDNENAQTDAELICKAVNAYIHLQESVKRRIKENHVRDRRPESTG